MADATDAELISICTCGCERWDYDGTCHDCGKSRRELLLQSRIEALAARVAVLEGALRSLLKYVPTGVVECRGDKCREPWCASCFGWEAAEEGVEKACTDGAIARAALTQKEQPND